ncbi:MAG: DUF4261 domain-containing protein [Gemmataceae bacterium]
MPKGFFTQGLVVLLERPVTLDAVADSLRAFDVRAVNPEAGPEWAFGGPSVVVAYREEVNGAVCVDLVERQWPDHMGDTKQEMMLFGAWSMGHFGPFAFPFGLQRAGQHCWAWEPACRIAEGHCGFIRLRSSYVFGGGDDALIMPEDYDAEPELLFVTKLASAVLELPGALCYFNPGGEVLRDQDGLRESLNFAWSHKLPPLDVWCNIRLFKVNGEWSLMDSVGNGQLDIPDVEAGFHTDSYEPVEVDHFLRNVSLYLLKHEDDIIKDGDTMDGPGKVRWQAMSFESGLSDPPRRVLRWLPVDGRSAPRALVDIKT